MLREDRFTVHEWTAGDPAEILVCLDCDQKMEAASNTLADLLETANGHVCDRVN